MNQTIKQLLVLILMGSPLGVIHAQTLETAKSEYEMAASQTSSFVVKLKNAKADSYNALTLNMLMPEGISLVGSPLLTDKLDNPFCVTDESIILPNPTSYESLMFYGIGDMDQSRTIKMAVASATPLPGTEVDNFLTVDFKADETIAPNLVYTIKLQNILFEYEPKGKDVASDVSVRVRVYALGDASRKDGVNAADATLIINHILGRESSVEYNAMLADMNNDGVIDIFDVMKLINVILTGKLPVAPAPSMQRAAANGFYEDMTLAFSGNGVTMSIPNAQRFTSFQFEVEVPDNVELSGAKLIGVSTNHMVQFAKIEDNYYRVIGVSLDNSLLASNNGNNLIGLEIPNGGKLSIHNAMFVTPQGEVTYFNDSEIESGITSVRPITVTDPESVYDLLGRKVQTKNGHLPKGIYIINNKRVVVK